MDRRIFAWAADVAILLVGGTVTLFICSFFAYAFRDTTGLLEHSLFLGAVAVVAVVWGVLLGLLDTAILASGFRVGLTFGLLASAAVHLAAVAVGTVILLFLEQHGSVTADQPNAPFLALVVVCGALATACVLTASRVARPTLSS